MALGLVVLAACGGRGEPPRAVTTMVDGREVFLIHPPDGDCDDTESAACLATWPIESSLYTVACSPVPPDQRDGELYAVGVSDEVPFAEARLLPEVEPTERLAVRQRPPGGPCPDAPGNWVVLRHVAFVAKPVAAPVGDR